MVGSLGALETAVTDYNFEWVYIVDMSSAPVALVVELHMMLMVAVEMRPLLDQLVLVERHYRGRQSHS